jgi:hypothetical protein
MNTKKPYLAIASVTMFVFLGISIVSFFIRGYRFDIDNKTITTTGLLAANSVPKGASVYIDDKLITATDDTINLPPGEYVIKIVKDGFFPWQKKVTIKKEVVYQTGAELFTNTPDLKKLTSTGAINPSLSLDGQKIVYAVASSSASTKNGVWISNLNNGSLNPIRNSSQQLARGQSGIDWTKTEFIWSPDNSQILAISGSVDQPTAAYLLATDKLTPADQVRNVIVQLPIIINEWEQLRKTDLGQQMQALPPQLQEIASNSAKLITFSSKEKKFFYLATKENLIPENIIPHPPARSDQPEQRQIVPGRIYTYNLEEDTNFYIADADRIGIDWQKLINNQDKDESATSLEKYFINTRASIHWLNTNNHLVFIEDNQVKVVEVDGTNKQTVFAGPFINGYVFPSPNGNQLITLTALNPELPPNLYGLTIR